ncbi:MAG: PAS domain S-box protein [Bacteroidota bacterium]
MKTIIRYLSFISLLIFMSLNYISSAENTLNRTYDSIEVNRLNALTVNNYNFSLPKSLELNLKAIAIADSIDYKKGFVEALCNEAEIYFYLADNAKALQSVTKAIKIASEINDTNNLAHSYKILSTVCYLWNKPDEAIKNRLFAINLYSHLGDLNKTFDSFLLMGAYLRENSEYAKAYDVDAHALIIALKNLNHIQTLWSLIEMTNLYITLNYSLPARITLKICEQICNTFMIDPYSSYKFHSIEAYYQEKNESNIKKAIDTYILSTKTRNDTLQPFYFGDTYSKIAHLYSLINQTRNSLNYNIKALQIRFHVGNITLTGSSYTNIGFDYFNMNQFDSARIFLNKGLEIAKLQGKENFLANSYKKLYLLNKKIGKPDIALSYFELFTSINENIILQSKKLDLEKIQTKLELEENVTELTRAKLEKQQHLHIFAFILVFAALLIIIFIYASKNKFKKRFLELEKRYNIIINQLQEKIIESRINLDELKISEEKFRVLFEKNPVGIITISLDTLKITNANNSFCKMFEYSLDELTNLSINELIHPDDIPPEKQSHSPLFDQLANSFTITKRYSTKNNNDIWASLTSSIIYDVKKRPLFGLGIVQDVTEKRNTEANIIESEEKLRLLIDSSPFLIAMLDMEMRYIIVNEAFYTEFNLDYDIVGKKVCEVFPSTSQEVVELFIRAIQGDGFSNVESDFSLIDGNERWYNWSLKPWFQNPGIQSGIVQFAVNITQRIHYERQLNENVYLLNKIFQTIPNSIYIINTKTLNVVWATSNFYDSFGMTKDEYENTYRNELFSSIYSEDIIQVKNGIELLSNQEDGIPFSYEFRRKHKNGEWRWYYSKAVVFKRDANGEVEEILSTSLDITQRKQIETALSLSESKYREHLEQAADAIFTGNHQGNFINVNHQASLLTGYSKDELLGMNMSQLFTIEQLKSKPLDFDAILKGKSVQNERQLIRKDGNIISIEMSTKMLPDGSLQSIFHNITELKTTELKLRENEKKLHEAQKIAKMGSWTFDFKSNTLDYSDNIFAILCIPKPQENFNFTQEYFFKNVHPEDINDLLSFSKQQIVNKNKNYSYEFRITDNEGNIFYLETTGQLSYNDDGTLNKQIATIVDVTERKKSEIQLRKAFERERELNKLKSNFVSMISHEFRNPLASISSSNELLNIYFEKLETNDLIKIKSQKQIHQINNEIKRLILLIENVLIISKDEAGKLNFCPENVSLEEFIPELLIEIQRNIIDERLIKFQLFGEPVIMKIDKTLFFYILSNLVSNALKFSKGRPSPELNLVFTENSLQIEMKDYGIGIPDDEQKYLFDTFFRAKNASSIPGSGLGLVLIKHFLELHKGEIQINSAVEQGSTFTITIPIEKNV